MGITALAAKAAKGKLEKFQYDPGQLGDEQVEIAVTSCGVCHSDLSILNNEWGISAYPFVPGHEVVGTVAAVGKSAKRVKVGDTVGLGWYSHSCLTCHQCVRGDQNLCTGNAGAGGTPGPEQTIIGRHGGFANRVRANWEWVTPLPKGIDVSKAGPLFCGGITVFNPIVQNNIKPTDRVGVIGIGGLGHLALQFLNAWGCEVVAFTSSDGKKDEAIKLGAHRAVNSRDDAQLASVKGTLNFIINTANANMNWGAYIDALAPGGKLHTVGVVPEPIAVHSFPLIAGQKSIGGSPLGSPSTIETMLEFCARHKIAPVTETFKMSKANEALHHLESGKARYRLVLEQDLG